ncbi:Anaphase-promoting complex subunit 1 [Arachnomyces sp. PD_36]|nr:Anaphase-promoting complex subunit 1 [Arachnomyces sp. PD_36]
MASIRSLGLHEAAGIPYLTAESILPSDPSKDQYVWQVNSVDDGRERPVEEETVFTDNYVVWSQGGVVKRAFRLDIEGEEIVQSLFTYFPPGRKKNGHELSSRRNNYTGSTSQESSSTTPDGIATPTGLKGAKRQRTKKTGLDGIPIVGDQRDCDDGDISRALVVVLKTQAHIFFLAGDSHVVPLPFEVDSVLPTPRGLLFQRKMSHYGAPPVPLAPPNSFVSHPQGFRASQSFGAGKGSQPSLTISPAQPSKLAPDQDKDAGLPRVFTLMEPHSEMGLVVSSQFSRFSQTSQPTEGFDALDAAEEVIYVSPVDELHAVKSPAQVMHPLILVVTLNSKNGMYTIWTARYRDKESALPSEKRRKSDISGSRSKRRSSHFGMATGANTPRGRGPSGVRESFGGLNQGRNISGASQALNNPTSNPEGRTDDAEELASQLGHEFGDIGVPLKASRRVSSLLSRADLSTNHDRTAFTDLATGNQAASTIQSASRRGESFGGYGNRNSFGYLRRGSLPPASNSALSNTSSFLDAPVDKLLEGLKNGGDFEGFESMGLRETISGLPKEMMLAKVESFSSTLAASRGLPRKALNLPRPRVFTLSSPQDVPAGDTEAAPIAMCVLDSNSRSLVVVTLLVEGPNTNSKEYKGTRRGKKKQNPADTSPIVRATEVRHGTNVIDACRVVDGDVSRVLVLATTMDGRGELTLQAPWSTVVKIDLPSNMMIHEPDVMSLASSPSRPRDGGLKRVFNNQTFNIVGLCHPTSRGRVDAIDSEGRKHRIQIQMEPYNPLVKKVLAVCKFVLRNSPKAGDGILVGWWEVLKWLKLRNENADDMEWTALVVILFTMAVDFIEGKQKRTPAKQPRKKGGLLRSSSGSHIDLESWETMLDQEAGSSGVSSPWMMTASWGWIAEEDMDMIEETSRSTRTPRTNQQTSSNLQTGGRKNPFLTNCATLAREFLQTPQGEAASGSEGYLPTAISRSLDTRRTSLGTVLIGLHLVREEQKLSAYEAESSNSEMGSLAPVLAQIGHWLGWKSWGWSEESYYGVEMASMDRWLYEDSKITALDLPSEPFAPPSIFSYVEDALQQSPSQFLSILDLVPKTNSTLGKGRTWQQALRLTPRTFALTGFISEVSARLSMGERVQSLLRWGLTADVIETLPEGISAPLYESIVRCQTNPPTSWGTALLELIDRDDLCMSMNSDNVLPQISKSQATQTHDALRDYHQIGVSACDMDTINSFETSAEADRQSITRLIFREDRRFIEAAKLLNQMKAPVAECISEPEWSESDLLEAQKVLVQIVTMRTLSVPAGRAMINFSGRVPLLTEKLPIPSFSLQCIMKPSNVTISADRAAFTEEKVCWAFFHNGASTGLAISKAAKGIDTSWILYNKPGDLTNRHAGFLLALGLNGHLKPLAKWVAFKYLTPKHTMTSIGLLLGLSASYLGTMDTLITRLLSVHVTRMLPPGAAELNLSPLTQASGIMGIGLLYCGSQHRRMSEVMLSEIENVEEEEPTISQETLRDEGYRLSAGFALGFINLGKGKDLGGLRDMHIVERLVSLAVGTKDVDIVHILDRATAGATVALMIIFMKTNDEALARKVDIPDTSVQFGYVRPDIFLLRTLARHLIMWDEISPSHEWVEQSLPRGYRHKSRLQKVRRLSTDDMPFFNIIAGICSALGLRYAGSSSTEARDLLVSYLDQLIRICRLPALNYDGKLTRNSVRNCQDIVALSAAIVMAGTGDITVFRRLRSLHGRVDSETTYGSHMAAHMAIGALFLGGGSYTIGTSNLAIASLICAFYPIFPTTVLDNKCHLQAFRHLWVLAAEPRCLIPRDIDTRRPLSIPISLTLKDGTSKTLLAPCLLPDLSSLLTVKVRSPDYWSLTLDFSTNDSPLRQKLLSGENQSIYLRRRPAYNATGFSVFSSSLMALSETQDILASSVSAAANNRARQPALTTATATQAPNLGQIRSPSYLIWDWIFNLRSLQSLDVGEKALVLPSAPSFQAQRPPRRSAENDVVAPASPLWLRPSVVDTKLVLENTVENAIAAASGRAAGADEVRDRLWQLRLLFAWAESGCGGGLGPEDRNGVVVSSGDGDDGGDGGGGGEGNGKFMYLRRETIEEARWRIWGVQVGDRGNA